MNIFEKGVLLISLLILFIFTSCEDEISYGIGEYKVDLATVAFHNDIPYFILDSNKKLYNSKQTNYSFKEKDRVRLNYSYLTETQNGFDYVIKVNGVSKIVQGELIALNKTTIDTLANDPIRLESAWIGSTYLNVSFNFDYHSVAHKIYLVTDSAGLEDKDVKILFLHNKNDDTPGYKSNAIISFDLEKLLGQPKGKKILSVCFNAMNYDSVPFKYIY